MKLTQTLQPAHLIARLELLHANRALLLPALSIHTILLRSDVGEDAAGTVAGGSRTRLQSSCVGGRGGGARQVRVVG